MHLLAAQPGGFVDDEGIIDLDQTPAPVVILSAADSGLAALAAAAESLPSDFPCVRLANWMQLLKPAAFDLYQHKVLDHAKVVVVSLLGGRSYWGYGFEQLLAWQQARSGRTLILVPGDDTPDAELFERSSVPLAESQQVWRYLRESGLLNSTELFHFLAAQYLGVEVRWRAPQRLPRCMMYLPPKVSDAVGGSAKGGSIKCVGDLKALDSGATFDEWVARYPPLPTGPQAVCVLLFYRSHLQSANTAMFDGLIAALVGQGLRPLPIAVASLKDAESMALVNALIEQSGAQLLINTTGFSCNRVSSPGLSAEPMLFQSPFAKPLPVLQLVLSSSTQDDWQSYSQGLRSRDIAMQVVLPEMDGRIITRAVSFKSESHFSERCEVSVVKYHLHAERADFVAQLAARYCRLGTKTNAEKRLALILANYPTKDGRIGNGVGLDTPNSTVNILRALHQAGYPLAGSHSTGNSASATAEGLGLLADGSGLPVDGSGLPADGDALIQALLGAVTNNPNTLHARPCWQSLSLADYWDHFAALPVDCQRAVMERWGPPENDPKCRDGRLMLSGIRLGETFIGIQPARGFNLDLAANYHDPDLVPPHAYLAFYFWLRHSYQVDAIVHVGKHGNIEWLPGKGSALSASCWPDVAMGPTPHFYPFIVNDPGEGAQAKRRTQAVIIDHLMPPMTRAETYGDLADLEALVDEYYQALGMDTRREVWLREEIIKQVRSTHVLEELNLTRVARDVQPLEQGSGETVELKAGEGAANEQLLEQLHAYLCDIKEAQIRHGLHILGELPGPEKLTDTMVALLRLPRGDTPESQGVLHNLCADLGLRLADGQLFDPLLACSALWQGARPAVLQSLDAGVWRTELDTRERLELLAQPLVARYVIGSVPGGGELINAEGPEVMALAGVDLNSLPATARLLKHARDVVLAALHTSARLEIESLLHGLAGQFVEPGPSGAPTRGRLDTLPTGRNFFSVDNRSIPSPAAWAIGQRSADALIERHLQEHGDYPKQLGLSVWGTATMRTGGDDIAQAFALMGVRPIWAPGSQRVVDFEIVSTMLLGRPRVDVTLRVSGFFRDAFPNVMKLVDAAAMAIAKLDEPGNENTIRQNVEARQQQLMAEGLDEQLAWRQASYRVFGSKPGAYGAGLQGLIDERCWEKTSDLAEAYLNWGGYAYGDHRVGVAAEERIKGIGSSLADGMSTSSERAADESPDGLAMPAAFQHQLSQLDAVVQNQDNREHDLLDSDDYYQFQGGMTVAATVFGAQHGRAAPQVYHSDHSNPSAPKIRTLKEELNRVIRSRVLNPKWIEGMREHGYKGAFEMTASVDYLFAYDATTNLIDDYQYQQVADALVFDQKNRAFLEEHNPHALEEMAERLLEACQRGLWQDPGDSAERLQRMLLEIDEQQELRG